MSKIRLYGATSGYVDLAAPDVADDATLTLPTGADGFASEAYVDAAVAGVGPLGKILQVVEGTQTTPVSITATSYTTTNLSASITPSATSSNIFVIARSNLWQKRDADSRAWGEITRNGTQVFEQRHLLDGATSTNNQGMAVSWVASFVDSPNTTSSVTYALNGKLEYGFNNHASQWHQTGAASIILMEIGA